jgi:DNA-binding HxlR family transcriptional regulator
MKRAQEGTFLEPGHRDVPVPKPTEPKVCTESEDCRAVAEILARIGDKWTILVIGLLGLGPRRFNEIKRLVGGISQRMLTLTLKGLERDGLVTRTVTPSVPPRVDYALTELGADLLVPVAALRDWARKHEDCIQASRRRFDAERRA